MRRPNLWNAYTILVLTVLGIMSAYYYGAAEYLLANDVTRITFIIPALAVGVNVMVVWMLQQGRFNRTLLTQSEYIVDHLTSIGLFGTVVGLVYMIRHGIPEPTDLLIGVGTAMLTTLAGLMFTVIGNQVILQLTEGRRLVTKSQEKV